MVPPNCRERRCPARMAGAALASIAIALGCGQREATDTTTPPEVPAARPALPDPSPDEPFVDVAEPAGIDFVHSIGDHELSNLVEAVGGGAAFVDYDRDGWLDIYLVSAAYHEEVSEGGRPEEEPTNRLYRNRGNGTFRDVTAKAGVGDAGFGMGVCAGDFDNDGYPDLYVTNYGPNRLYRNDGDGTFEEVAEQAGVAAAGCSVGATFLDYDGDGLLDLYVGNYLDFDLEYKQFYAPDRMPGPLDYAAQDDLLYRNRGEGTFEDVSEAAGIRVPPGRTMGVASGDLDLDGDIDLYIACDGTPNFLFRNQGGRFEEAAAVSGVSYGESGEATVAMAMDIADYDRDGKLDVLVSDDAYGSLYRQTDGNRYRDMTAPAGLAQVSGQYVSWGTGFWDYDNDGLLDIILINGDLHRLEGQEDCVFRGDGAGHFEEVSSELGAYFDEQKLVGRGCALGDYDNDGDVDVLIQNLNGRAVLLRNDVRTGNHWLTVELKGTRSNRDAIGARVTVKHAAGQQTALRRGAYGYLSANDPRLHFGLGAVDDIDNIEVVWPSGTVQNVSCDEVDQILTIEEPSE